MKKWISSHHLFSPWIHRGIIFLIVLLTGTVWALVTYITFFVFSNMVIEFQFTPQNEAMVIDKSSRSWIYGWISLIISIPSLLFMYGIHCSQSTSTFMRHVYSYWLGGATLFSLLLLITYLVLILIRNS